MQAGTILVAAGVIYWPALHGGWLWDDDIDITRNPVIHSATGLWTIWFQPGAQLDYYPAKATVQWVEWHLWGDDTLGYHVTNVALHIVSGLLVWKLFARLGVRLAWLGGLIFVVHPALVESVAWIAELKNTLSLPPFLMAMIFYVDYDAHHRPRDYLLALGLFLVAMLCKPSMVMFPFVILLYVWWKRGRIGWGDVKAIAPFFAISLVLGLVTLWVGTWYEESHHMGLGKIPQGGFLSRLALASSSIAFYFMKAVWPMGLLPIYPKWSIDPPSLMEFLPLAMVGGITYWLWWKRQSWGRHVLLGLGFFLIMLAPFVSLDVGGYTSFTWVMDHFLYIPIIGLIGLVVVGLGWIDQQLAPSFRRGGLGIVVAVMALLIWESRLYAAQFVSETTLWTYALQGDPDSWVAHRFLGTALLEEGQVDSAMEHLQKAVEINPNDADAHNNLGRVLMRKKEWDEALAQFQMTLDIEPNYAEALANVGSILMQKGRIDEAIAKYQSALAINPGLAGVHYNLGWLLLRRGQADEAVAHFHDALEIDPNYAGADYILGCISLQRGELDEAIAQFQKAIASKPDDANAHNNLGNAFAQKGQADQAMAQYQMTLQIDPDATEARNNLGNILLQQGRWDEAVAQFRKTLEIKPGFAEVHNNLGWALLQKGHWDEAVAQFQEVVRLKPDDQTAKDNLAKAQAMRPAK